MILAIVQARMGSTRLEGKVLKESMGKPLLWYLKERLKKSRMISKIVIATSDLSQNDCIEDFCLVNGTECFRGSESDVLDRYYQCAKTYGAEQIIRISADCPLIEPAITDDVVNYYNSHPEYDLVKTGPSYPDGFDTEVFSFESLKTAWQEAKTPFEREHVVPFMSNDKARFKIKILSLKKDYSFLRLTVDELADFNVINNVIEELFAKKGVDFSFEDILQLYQEKPSIFEQNSHLIGKEGIAGSIKND